MRLALGTVLAATALLFADTASATVTGTISGRVRVSDSRPFAADGSGATPSAGSGFLAVGRVVLAVTAIPADNGGELDVVNPTFFAVTHRNGEFTASWRDNTRDSFPTRVRIQVLWIRSDDDGGTTSAPPAVFRIARFDDVSARATFTRTIRGANRDLGNLTATQRDESAAYLTTQEFFRRVVRFSDRLQARMPGLVVKTRVPNFSFAFGVAPHRHEVLISSGAPITSPLILAHELGHAVDWAALQLQDAPINPVSDYALSGPGWSRTSRESSKAAFQEALADAWALEWAFGSDINAALTAGPTTFRFETARVTGSGGFRCRTVGKAHEIPFCLTAAIRDLLDNDGSGGDGVDLSRADIVNTLNRFPNGCFGNGCRDEPGLDGLNHHDFRCNARSAFRARITGVWAGNRVNGGPASFC
jgi:hypothetical protein